MSPLWQHLSRPPHGNNASHHMLFQMETYHIKLSMVLRFNTANISLQLQPHLQSCPHRVPQLHHLQLCTLRWCNTHLFLVLASRRVQRLDQSGGVADKHGVAGGSDDHTEHGEPDVWHALWSLSPISNTQHVAHGFKEGKGIELAPGIILQAQREGRRQRQKSSSNLARQTTRTRGDQKNRR